MATEIAEIRFEGSNLQLLFEGQWESWHTTWGGKEYDKTVRFRAFRDRVAEALNGMKVDITEYPEKVQA